MNHHRPPRALALLLAAAVLPLNPGIAQDGAAPAPQPADAAPAREPPVATAPTATTPVEAPPAPAGRPAEADPPAAEASTPPPPRATAPRASAPETTTVTISSVPAPPVSSPGTVIGTVPVETLPPAVDGGAYPTEVLPEPVPGETVAVRAAETPQRDAAFLPWLLAGLVLGGILTFLLVGRRRRSAAIVRHAAHEPAVAVAPVVAAPEPVAAVPLAAARPAGTNVAAPTPLAATVPAALAASAPAHEAVAAPAAAARPWLDLLVRPVRAGFENGEARVDFALDVANQGDAPARDVRVSTWMFSAGTRQESAMERMLIERDPRDAELPPTTIEAGSGQRIEATVALSRAEIAGDAVLPVVVAEARYRLPDGREGRTAASFAVGVPDGEELAFFDVRNPSGLHDGVEARALGEPERI